MPHSYAPQFRAMVVDQVRSGLRVAEVAASVDVAEATVYRWVRQDRIDRGELAGTSSVDNAELRAAKRRIAELESELAVVKRASVLFDEGRVMRQKQCSTSWRPWLVKVMAPSGSVAFCGSLHRDSFGGGPCRRRIGRSAGRGSPT
jgi:transposase-like protein